MALGLVGKKCGMTRVFTETGESIPVTVIEVLPNRIAQVKNNETDGYSAVQVTYGVKKANKLTKAIAGHYAKAKVEPGTSSCEFRVPTDEGLGELKVGDELTVSLFEEGQKVDLRGLSRGKGFAGVVKRYNFRTQDATHGNSLAHRAPGSIGQCQTPGRVVKGKKMAGHMGDANCSVQHQEIVKIDAEKNIILVKGAAPGAPGGELVIKCSVKTKKGDK